MTQQLDDGRMLAAAGVRLRFGCGCINSTAFIHSAEYPVERSGRRPDRLVGHRVEVEDTAYRKGNLAKDRLQASVVGSVTSGVSVDFVHAIDPIESDD